MMTENKRFERIYGDVDIFCRDHNAKGISQLIKREDYDKIVVLLNELHDEKEQLKDENKLLKARIEVLNDEIEQHKAVINKKWDEYLKKNEVI